MTSSTSSSDLREGRINVRTSILKTENGRSRWWPAWTLAMAFLLLATGVWEWRLRSAAILPEYVDNRELWVATRHDLNDWGSNSIAVLGASRVQRAIHPETLARELGGRVAQLAVEGTSAIPLLEDLAVDPRFAGTILFSVAPAFSFNRRLSKLDAGNQSAWVAYYRSQSRSQRIEHDLRLAIQGLFAFRSPDAAVTRVLPEIFKNGNLPGPDFKHTFRDRSVSVDYAKFDHPVNPQSIVDLYLENTEPYEAAEFAHLVNYVSALVEILKAKGCRVIFLRLPSGGIVRQLERRMFPSERFWGYMEQNIGARFVHFEDYPELAGYLSIDGSHVASEKSAAFTKALARVIRF
ncbi:MAG: hypothetical protein ACE5OQ_17400 [Woeseia sp.]